MFKKYNLTLNAEDFEKFPGLTQSDLSTFNTKSNAYKEELNNRLDKTLSIARGENGEIDASKLIRDWFPTDSNVDIFISHSHGDINDVIKLGAWLTKTFQLNVFIDSLIWGNSNELLKNIDKNYAYNEDQQTYDYQTRNITTSHVHMMLSTALNDMIDTAECIIFVNTPSSITLSTDEQQGTASPWIYSELKSASLLRTVIPQRFYTKHYIKRSALDETLIQNAIPEFKYDVNQQLTNFTKLEYDDLKEWSDLWIIKQRAGMENGLDVLYQVKGEFKE